MVTKATDRSPTHRRVSAVLGLALAASLLLGYTAKVRELIPTPQVFEVVKSQRTLC